jgi:hypothetical protein
VGETERNHPPSPELLSPRVHVLVSSPSPSSSSPSPSLSPFVDFDFTAVVFFFFFFFLLFLLEAEPGAFVDAERSTQHCPSSLPPTAMGVQRLSLPTPRPASLTTMDGGAPTIDGGAPSSPAPPPLPCFVPVHTFPWLAPKWGLRRRKGRSGRESRMEDGEADASTSRSHVRGGDTRGQRRRTRDPVSHIRRVRVPVYDTRSRKPTFVNSNPDSKNGDHFDSACSARTTATASSNTSTHAASPASSARPH